MYPVKRKNKGFKFKWIKPLIHSLKSISKMKDLSLTDNWEMNQRIRSERVVVLSRLKKLKVLTLGISKTVCRDVQ